MRNVWTNLAKTFQPLLRWYLMRSQSNLKTVDQLAVDGTVVGLGDDFKPFVEILRDILQRDGSHSKNLIVLFAQPLWFHFDGKSSLFCAIRSLLQQPL